jgi:hypothetical protein
MAKTKIISPVTQQLPPYVLARDELAAGAGLRVSHYYHPNDAEEIVSEYAGSDRLIRSSPFVSDATALKIPTSVRHCAKQYLEIPWAPRRWKGGIYRLESGEAAIKLIEFFPSHFETIEGGVEQYSWDGKRWGGHYSVYRGTKTGLLEAGIVCPQDFPAEGEEERIHGAENDNGCFVTFWELRDLEDGTYEYIRHISDEAKYREQQRDRAEAKTAPLHESAESFREWIAERVVNVAERMVTQMMNEELGRSVEYFFDQAAIDEVMEAFDDVRSVIQAAPILQRKRVAPKRAPIAGFKFAQNDPSFAAFMQGLKRVAK